MGQSNLWRVFLATAARSAAAPALVLPDRDVSFADLKQTALRASAYLTSLGVARSDVVALQIPKRLETYALMLACLRIGAIYVCLDPKNPAERTRKVVTRIEPKLLFTETPLEGVSARVIDGATLSADAWPAPLPEIDLTNESNGGTPAYLMFTSGS